MDERTQFHFRFRSFVRGRPVARVQTRRLSFGEGRQSCDELVRRAHARSGFKRFIPTGYFGAPFRDLRMSTVLRLLPALILSLLCCAVAPAEMRAADDGALGLPPVEVLVPLHTGGASGLVQTVRVEAGSHVVLSAGKPAEEGAEVRWLRDGQFVPAVGGFRYDLGVVDVADSGDYEAQVSSMSIRYAPLRVRLLVLDAAGSRIQNCSLRGAVTAEVPRIIGGIVVGADDSHAILVRAVGPTLAQLGVENPLPDPQLRFFDAQGRPADQHILSVSAAVVGIPTIEEQIEAIAAALGAFPLPRASGDVAYLVKFPPGAYTAHVSSRSGATGEVLFEFYDVPHEILPRE